MTRRSRQPRIYNNSGYLPNGATNLPPGAAPLLPNQGRIIQTGPIRVLCIADVRGAPISPIPNLTFRITQRKGNELLLTVLACRKPSFP